jgi:hypothetical protein
MVEAKAALAALRSELTQTERALAAERAQLEATERRGRLAAEIPDAETVAVAERFAAKHRERVSLLERKLQVQQDEVALAERDLEELTRQYRGAPGAPPPPPDEADPLLQYRLDRAAQEAAAEAQLAQLKRKLGKDQSA